MIKNKSEQIENNLSKEDLLKWIKNAEKSQTMSLEKFNERWEEKKLKIIKTQQL